MNAAELNDLCRRRREEREAEEKWIIDAVAACGRRVNAHDVLVAMGWERPTIVQQKWMFKALIKLEERGNVRCYPGSNLWKSGGKRKQQYELYEFWLEERKAGK